MKSVASEPFIMSSRVTPLSTENRRSVQEFRELVEAHQSRVYSIAFRILGDSGLAEEVAQDVFMALYTNLDQLENEEHLLAWLRRVTVHRATDAWRRRSSRLDSAATEFHEERTVAFHNQARAPSDSQATRLEQLIATLRPAQRAIVLLRYQEDMTPTEIAATLSMPLATVKSNLQRALKLLRVKAERQKKELSHG